MDYLVNLFNSNPTIIYGLLTSLGFIFADTLITYLVALKNGTFDVSLMPKFLASNIFPYCGGLIVIAAFSLIMADMVPVFVACCGLVSVKFGKEIIIDKITQLFS